MIGLVFAILFGLNFVSLPCEGKIFPPDSGYTYVVPPGDNVTIAWKIDPTISVSDLVIREWRFFPTGETLADIIYDRNVTIKNTIFAAWIEIIKPSTLILKNVDKRFNGIYRFGIRYGNLWKSEKSDVKVFVAVKPVVSVKCSSSTTLNESEYFACECKGEGGTPAPADVTWYKGNKQIVTGKEKSILRLPKVDKGDSGTYRCEAKSGVPEAANETTIELIVNFQPTTNITFEPGCYVLGGPCIVTCESTGFPAPSHTISHNGVVVSTTKTYTIDAVKYSDAGIYKCLTKNIAGNDSAFSNLTVRDISGQVNVTINCSNPVTLNEGDGFACVCTNEVENLPVYLTWYKDGKRIGNANYGENRLTLTRMTKRDSGNYSCEADSYTVKDKKSIEIKVNFKPTNTTINIEIKTGNDGVSVVTSITCTSDGFPEPSYNITHNGILVNNIFETHPLNAIGTFKCIAWNKLGRDSASETFSVKPRNTTINIEIKTDNVGVSVVTSITCNSDGFPEPNYNITHNGSVLRSGKVNNIPETHLSASGTFECIAWNNLGMDSAFKTISGEVTCSKLDCDSSGDTLVWHIVVTLLSGIIIGIMFFHIVSYLHRRWCKNRKPERKSELQTDGVDTTYQELDLTKMNKEDNYQSLRGNVAVRASNDAANDEESTYTQLSKTRDVEDNYQSLT